MTLTPLDIQSKQFHVRFRGFDVEEVDAFLEQVAENLLILVEENKTLTQKVESLTQDLSGMKVEESTFKDAIISAQQVAEEMKNKSRQEADELATKTRDEADELLESARQESEEVLKQAEEEATRVKDEAHQEVTELEQVVDQLKGVQFKLKNELRNVLQSYQKFLDLPDEVLNSGQVSASLPDTEQEISTESADADADDSGAEIGDEVDDTTETDEQIPEPDLSDLYEKIDLPPQEDDEVATQSEDDTLMDLSEPILPNQTIDTIELGDDDSPNIPDLDDDYMFTLEDPLDDEGDDKKE